VNIYVLEGTLFYLICNNVHERKEGREEERNANKSTTSSGLLWPLYNHGLEFYNCIMLYKLF